MPDKLVFTIKREVAFTGTHTGTAQFTEVVVIAPDGDTTVVGAMDFVGTACGTPARLKFLMAGRGNQLEGVLAGSYAVLGSGRRVVGRGTFTGTPGGAGTYSGAASC